MEKQKCYLTDIKINVFETDQLKDLAGFAAPVFYKRMYHRDFTSFGMVKKKGRKNTFFNIEKLADFATGRHKSHR